MGGMRAMTPLLCLLLSVGMALAAYMADKITSLPNLSGSLPSAMWAGYLKAGPNNRIFYWYVESENNPATDPVSIWFNGGPGCSSLGGMWMENGPFEVSPDGQTLTLREFRWSRFSNMLWFENPIGVGFSYSKTNNYSASAVGDFQSAETNLLAVKDFFLNKMPERRGNALHLVGESYAGICE